MTVTRHCEQPLEVDTIHQVGGNAVKAIAWTGSGNCMTFDAQGGMGRPGVSVGVYGDPDSAWGLACMGQHIGRAVKGELCFSAGDVPVKTHEAVGPPQRSRPRARCQPFLPDDVKVTAGLARGPALGQVCDDLSNSPRVRSCSRRQLTHRPSHTGHPLLSLVDSLYRYAHLCAVAIEPRPSIGRPAQSLHARARGLSAGGAAEGMSVSPVVAGPHCLHALVEARWPPRGRPRLGHRASRLRPTTQEGPGPHVIRDIIYAAGLVAFCSTASAVALGAVLALGVVLTIAGTLHAYRRSGK